MDVRKFNRSTSSKGTALSSAWKLTGLPMTSTPTSLPGSGYSSAETGTSPDSSVDSTFFRQDYLFSSFLENNVKELIVFDMRHGICAKSQKQICYLRKGPSVDYNTALVQELSEIYDVPETHILRKQISFVPTRSFPEFRRKSKKGDREVAVLMDSYTDYSDQTFVITTFHPDESQDKIRVCQRHEKTDLLERCVELAIKDEINARPQDFHILKGALKLDRTKTFEESLSPELTSLEIEKQRDITIRCVYNHTGDSKTVYNLRCLSTDNVQEAKLKFFRQFRNTHPNLTFASSPEQVKIWFLQNDRYLKDTQQIILETEGAAPPDSRTSLLTEGSVTVDITGSDGISITLHLRQLKADAIDKKKVVAIPRTSTLDDLKEVVSRYFSIPTYAQRLRTNRKTLQNGAVHDKQMLLANGCVVNIEKTKPFSLLFDPDENLQRKLSLPSVISMDVYKGHKVKDIQDLLAARISLPSFQLSMTFQGIQLNPDSEYSLRDHRIRNRDIVELTWFPNRVLLTLIAPWQGRKKHTVVVDDTEISFVRDLKHLIGENIQMQSAQLNLLHKHRCLEDGCTLLRAGISNGDTIIVTRRTAIAAFSELPANCGGVFQCENDGSIQQLFVTYVSGIPFYAPPSINASDFNDQKIETISSASTKKIGNIVDRSGNVPLLPISAHRPLESDCRDQGICDMNIQPLDENVTTDAILDVPTIEISLSDSAMGCINRSRCGHSSFTTNTELSSSDNFRRIKSDILRRCRRKEDTDPKEYMYRRCGVYFDRPCDFDAQSGITKQPVRRQRSNTTPKKLTRSCNRHSYKYAIQDENSSDEESPNSSTSPTSSCEMRINAPTRYKCKPCQKNQNNLSNAPIDGNTVRNVACRLGKKWRHLARSLRLPEYEIEDIDNNYSQNLHEQSYQSLLRWRQITGKEASKRVLVSSLIEVGLRDIVDTLHLEYETS